MKKKSGTKLALAIAIIQHPAVQEAAKKIGKASLRKAQAWWEARNALRPGALELPQTAKNTRTGRKKSATKKITRKRKPKQAQG